MSLREAIRSADITEVDATDYTKYREAAEKVLEILQEGGDDAIAAIDLPNEKLTGASIIMDRVQSEAEDALGREKKVHVCKQQVDREDRSKGFTVFFSFKRLPVKKYRD